MMPLESWQTRVLEEKDDLDERVEKLGAFTNQPQYFQLPPEQRALLLAQLDAMRHYSNLLAQRIRLFPAQDYPKYSPEWVRRLAKQKKAGFLINHDCSLCGVPVGYVISGDQVFYRSGCDCSWAPDYPSSWGEISSWLQAQKDDSIRDRLVEGFR